MRFVRKSALAREVIKPRPSNLKSRASLGSTGVVENLAFTTAAVVKVHQSNLSLA